MAVRPTDVPNSENLESDYPMEGPSTCKWHHNANLWASKCLYCLAAVSSPNYNKRRKRPSNEDDVQAVLKALKQEDRGGLSTIFLNAIPNIAQYIISHLEPTSEEMLMNAMAKDMTKIKNEARRAELKMKIVKLVTDTLLEDMQDSS